MAIALVGILGGVFIALLFGANEKMFKEKILAGLNNNPEISAIEIPAEREKKIASEESKIWRHYQRYHFHATGIGALSLAVLLMLFLRTTGGRLRDIAAYSVAIGGFLYPFAWLLSAFLSPTVGRHEAHETATVLALGGGLLFIGLILSLVHLLISKPPTRKKFYRHKKQQTRQ